MALQAQQIVALAAQIAGVPGFIVQGGEFLNMILSDLCQTYDFDVAKQVTYITLGSTSGPYELPSNYLRTLRNDVFFTYNGVQYALTPIDLVEYDLLVQQAGMNSFPAMYATDMSQSPPQMWVWPPPSGAYVLTVRYYSQMSDITSPEASTTIPWFPNQEYLTTRLAGELMRIADDERAQSYLKEAEGVLDKYLKMKDDRNTRAERVHLDRRYFGAAFNKVANTKTLGWAVAGICAVNAALMCAAHAVFV